MLRRGLVAVLGGFLVAACSDDTTSPSPGEPRPSMMVSGFADGWGGGSASPGLFDVGRDLATRHAGAASAYLRSRAATVPPGQAIVLAQAIRATQFRSKRLRLSGFVRADSVTGEGAGLWMRVDGPNRVIALDNMLNRALLGSRDWQEVSVVLDIPPDASVVTFGALLVGAGTLRIDDLRLEEVSNAIAVTADPAPSPTLIDPILVINAYSQSPEVPQNLDFEGVPRLETLAATRAWVRSQSFLFGTDDPAAAQQDLAPLATTVGTSRLVGMGEATHGTREFFRMKHRVFRYLVENHGFTTFAIEASWPEALDVDRYVRTGEGNPEQLVANMYFWTWRTEEVVDLVRWMREYNRRAGAPRLRFVGVDMQFPGAAIDSVESFVRRVDTMSVAPVRAGYSCLTPFRNTRQSPSPNQSGYAALPASTRQACRDAVRAVRQLFTIHGAEWSAAATLDAFALAERSARLVEQWEEMASGGSSGTVARDQAMAENTAWWLDQGGSAHKMMVWAHNFHVSGRLGAMGSHLRSRYGSEYLAMGFTFGQGDFNAVGQLPNGNFSGLALHNVPGPLPGTIEALFAEMLEDRVVFDARRVSTGGEAALPLRRRVTIREIGSAFGSSFSPSVYQRVLVLPADYDVLIWFKETTASRIYALQSNVRPHSPSPLIASDE